VLPQVYQLALPCCNDASQPCWLPEPRCNDVLQVNSDGLQCNKNALQRCKNALLRCKNALLRCKNALLRCKNALQFVFWEYARG
jgi:hypothetical protein